jgi:hypothetical protein
MVIEAPVKTEKEVIKTQNWELPVESLDGWRPYTAEIPYQCLEGPDTGHHKRSFNLFRDMMIGINGARGAGKSTTNTFLAMKKMRMGKPCWSNVPISFYVLEADGSRTYYESMPLDVEKFSNFSPELRRGVVSIQELQYYVEARTSGRLQNRMMSYGIMQIRKTANSFFYDVQDPSWVDKRFGWSNDCDIECTDASKLNYDLKGDFPQYLLEDGKYLKEGVITLWTIKDTSGILTGIPFKKSGVPVVENAQFKSWYIWDSFPTHFIVDAWAAYHSIKTKDDNKKKEQEALLGVIEEAINRLLQQGKGEVVSSELWNMIEELSGKEVNKQVAGALLKDCGIPKRQRADGNNYYNIAVLLDDKVAEAATNAQ